MHRPALYGNASVAYLCRLKHEPHTCSLRIGDVYVRGLVRHAFFVSDPLHLKLHPDIHPGRARGWHVTFQCVDCTTVVGKIMAICQRRPHPRLQDPWVAGYAVTTLRLQVAFGWLTLGLRISPVLHVFLLNRTKWKCRYSALLNDRSSCEIWTY